MTVLLSCIVFSPHRLAFRTLVRKYNCDICFTPMIVAADFVRSAKARDSEFTTNERELLHDGVVLLLLRHHFYFTESLHKHVSLGTL